jgi:hypothetical protein
MLMKFDLTGTRKQGSNAVRGSTFREKFGYPPTPTLAMELLVFLFLVGLFLL